MRNRNCFDDPARANLFRDRIHCTDHRHRETGSVEFFANHSTAATAGSSGSDQQHAVDAFFAQVGADLPADAAHDRG